MVTTFDPAQMRQATATLPSELGVDASLGAVLAAACLSCELRPCTPRFDDGEDGGGEGGLPAWCEGEGEGVDGGVDDDDDAIAIAAATIALLEVERACKGLCAPAAMRQAAVEPLALLPRLLRRPYPLGHHALFAAAAAKTLDDGSTCYAPVAFADAARADDFAALVRMWQLLKLDGAQKRGLDVGAEFVLQLTRNKCAPSTAQRLEAALRLLQRPGPRVSGHAIAGVAEVPPHLRGPMLAHIQVLCRLRGETPALETPSQLADYLQSRCNGLLTKLREEWWETPLPPLPPPASGEPAAAGDRKGRRGAGGVLRPEYSKEATVAWLRGLPPTRVDSAAI